MGSMDLCRQVTICSAWEDSQELALKPISVTRRRKPAKLTKAGINVAKAKHRSNNGLMA